MSVSKRGRNIIRASTVSIIIAAGVLILTAPGAPSRPTGQAAPREPLELTYIANSGALVAFGDLKVLIDALFDKPNPEYRAPEPGARPFIDIGSVVKAPSIIGGFSSDFSASPFPECFTALRPFS